MGSLSKNATLLLVTIGSALVMAAGCWWPSVWLVFGGAIGFCYVLAQLVWLRHAAQ